MNTCGFLEAISVFGKYYIPRKDGNVEDIAIKSEEEVVLSLQKSRNSSKHCSNCIIDKKKNGCVFLTKDTLNIYLELKSYVDSFINDVFNPTHVISSTIFKKTANLEELQKLFGLDLFECSKDLILRPATDFGIFTLLENSTIRDCDLPKCYYERGLCYRLEDAFDGSLVRSYSFELPDIHTVTQSDCYEIVKQHMVSYKQFLDKLGITRAVALRITEKEFFSNAECIKDIAATLNEDIFLNVVPASIRYWESKFKFVQINSEGKKVQLSTVQVDYNSSKIFNFKGENNKYLTVIHSSPGSLQRLLCCLNIYR